MEKCPVSFLMSLLPPGLAVGPSLSCGGALGLWWVGFPLEAGSELPRGRGLLQDVTNHTETTANQNTSTLLPLFLRFACQAQSVAQQNLSVQSHDQRIRATRTVQTGTELLLEPDTELDAVGGGNSEKANETETGEVFPLPEKSETTVNDETHKMTAAETDKCFTLKETERDDSKMEDSEGDTTKKKGQKNKTQQNNPMRKMSDSENDLVKSKRVKMDETQSRREEKQEMAPPTVRCSSRLALKPRLVHHLSTRVTPPFYKSALTKRKQQNDEEERRTDERMKSEESAGAAQVNSRGTKARVRFAPSQIVPVSAPAQVTETTCEAVTVETTGQAVTAGTTGGRERRHICPTCGKSFFQKSHLKKHEVSHSDEKPFTCDKCERRYCSKESYRAHQLLHQGARPFPCPLCPKAYGLKRDLKEHMVLHSGLRPHQCPDCGRGFTRRPSLRAHRLNHCERGPRDQGPKVQVQCSVCSKFLANSGSLKNHMKIHTGERPHICQYCGKSFSQRGNLVAHVRAHSGERPFTCTHCGRSFGQWKELQRHQQVHSGTAFLCSSCGKVLRDAHTLRAHEALHEGNQAHCCPLCPKRYVSVSKLRRHLRCAHSTEKPFTCHCGSAYSMRQSLVRHQALHRLDETGAGPHHGQRIGGQACESSDESNINCEENRAETEELLIIQEVAQTVEINTG